MNIARKFWGALCGVALSALLLAGPAHAGRSCEHRPLQVWTLERSLTLAQRTRDALDASGAQVVLLARAGQDLSKYGLRWSHLGLAYKAPARAGEDDGRGYVWRVLHKLNHCGTQEAALYRQGLGDFFLDDLWRLEAAWVLPTREVQLKLHALLLDERKAKALHHAPYNLVSYPWSRKYQQSNQWGIETLAAAMEPSVYSRERAQEWLRFQGYEPTVLRLGAFTRLGARVSAANVAFDDHPGEKRYSDRIETVTVDSVFAWLQRAGLAGAPVTLRY
ncbi:MAG: DUF2145 domain-containing protein [Hylemonella sp.]|uniref:DUF2145 domain-containing protein n=1 Tax=Hylemonella sp. TaxID=2066020 RepID=UPI00391CDA6B